MRLIDADKLPEAIHENVLAMYEESVAAKEDCLREIEEAPTVDAVVVTRCKDCKYYRNHPNGLCYLHTEPKANGRGYSGEAVCVEPDDFCSYGERREG